MTEDIDRAKHVLCKCRHKIHDLLESWDKTLHGQRMKLVEHITHDFPLLQEALQEQSKPLRITMLELVFLGGILAVLVLFKLIAASSPAHAQMDTTHKRKMSIASCACSVLQACYLIRMPTEERIDSPKQPEHLLVNPPHHHGPGHAAGLDVQNVASLRVCEPVYCVCFVNVK